MILSGNNCLNPNIIQLSVTFIADGTANLNSVFNSNFGAIITGMAAAAQVFEKDILINSINYGSITLNSQVTTSATPGSATDTQIRNNLNNYFDNLNIPNLKVETTSVVPPDNSGNNDNNGNNDNDDGSNTTLIIAIVVPIVVVCTFIPI